LLVSATVLPILADDIAVFVGCRARFCFPACSQQAVAAKGGTHSDDGKNRQDAVVSGVSARSVQSSRQSGDSTPIHVAQLGGSGNAILRVIATDGVNTAQADSAPFTMENKPPQPMILTPGNDTHRHYGQLVNFSGEALDFQDGSVGDANLVWTNQYGMLGKGSLLSISNLPVGLNLITLTATNSVGLSAKTSITVIVDDNLNLPGPTLSAGPTQFAWSFASNTAPSQKDTLKLANAGGGTLTWKASTDAPWLKLSATQGTVPFTMTLTADPAGIPNDTAHSGHIILTAPPSGGQLTQTLSIPVSLAVGGSASNPPFWVTQLYLPIVIR